MKPTCSPRRLLARPVLVAVRNGDCPPPAEGPAERAGSPAFQNGVRPAGAMSAPARAAGARAFTLPEVLIAMSIATLVLGAVMGSHLFGLRMFELTRAKLGASDDARRALNLMIGEIRAAKVVRIGQGDQTAFAEIPPNTPQAGNAIQVYGSTNTNSFVRYFYLPADRSLRRLASGSAQPTVVAGSVSNQTVFTSEDFSGRILTNNENNRVIGLALQFYQLQYPAVAIGPGNHFDSYQLRTRITRRALE